MKRPMGILAVLVSLFTVISTGTANAAESIPELQWPAVDISPYGVALAYFVGSSISVYKISPLEEEGLLKITD